ncbi:hypothetical protein [Bradyrhizobium sp. CCBAU 21360]|uniref:hypothetical protein n=1 Tax=Bradyrhizobium sp. CCBAU 21360 TaxID=1325081 RepID=UPI002305ACC9|nr:hypothetical protein [Bradyrhizobium sp. CCBAU 21360]
MTGSRAAFYLTVLAALFAIVPPANANPLQQLLEYSMKLAGRTPAARQLSFEARAALIANDQAFRATFIKELEQTGDRAIAGKLADAWARADSPVYQEAILCDVQLLKAIKSVGIVLPKDAPASAQEDIASVVSSLIDDSLDDVPISAFASEKSLRDALTKAVIDRAAAQSKSSDSKLSFEISSGKLTVPFKTEVLGVGVKVGEINVYKVIGTTAALIACRGAKCIEDTLFALFKEDGKKDNRETPAQSNERLRRLARESANSDDPLRAFVVSVRSEPIAPNVLR